MEHPVIKNMMRTGDPHGIIKDNNPVTCDKFGLDCYVGDEIYELENEVYLVEELPHEAIVILNKIGADRYRL